VVAPLDERDQQNWAVTLRRSPGSGVFQVILTSETGVVHRREFLATPEVATIYKRLLAIMSECCT
jgi:hypothetical protein